ncbi:MAG: hypothetical protein U0M15_07940 [Bacillota bacterium]|nr:hypothetical protein [Bacillota bacterium]
MKKIYEYQEKLMEKETLQKDLGQLARGTKLLQIKNQYRKEKQRFLKIRRAIDGVAADQRQAEATLKAQAGLAQSMETALYDGTIKDPKELSFMENKVRETKQAMESSQKELAKIAETLQTEISRYRDTAMVLKSLQRQFEESQKTLKQQHAALDQQITALEEELTTMAQEIDPETLGNFLSQRKYHQGRLYSMVIHGNTCGCCYQKMPRPILNRLKSGKRIVCDHCDRILIYEKEEKTSQKKGKSTHQA